MRAEVQRKEGFTLMELIIGILVNSILALTVGAMLFYSYAGWRRHTAAAEMQRDGTFAMQMIAERTRVASGGRVQAGPDLLILPLDPATEPTMRFYDNGAGDLLFDPDLGVAGPEVTVIDGRLDTFNVSADEKALYVQLILTEADEDTDINATITFRN